MSDLVLSTIEDRVAILTLNRPDKRNALSRELIAQLTAAFARADADPAVRCIVLTGNGPAFCAGMDLDELRGTLTDSAEIIWEDAHKLSALLECIYRSSKPTVAAVNGAAVAGGAGLVTVCDLAVAAPGAILGYPEVHRGLVAAMVMPHLLRHVGERTARLLLLTGQLIDAAVAERVGLINHVADSEPVLQSALRLCEALTRGGPKALATTKELLRACSRQAVSVSDLAKASAEPRLGEECREGLTAFFEKRTAPWG
ncbi:enoyl-CoA hydratase/isomerase family protein [Limnoglobus roseus]|uniref:Enoyl-CoA hydratase n=1 Tax=Limnoglobus roseus TaxID=2598579 RepID=A0A5C1ANL1_9BACT|nr:enoyl-CoA hydratase-related protein [Limnoglobus roseus]QEL20155.1 enoyl-CoA hydratase [Limnoglobus roseus]